VAVSIFKGALTLEVTRRDNDKKVLALNVKMCDMMSVLSLYVLIHSSSVWDDDTLYRLNDMVPGSEGKKTVSKNTIDSRLEQKLLAITDSMKDCAKLCDSYQGRNFFGTRLSYHSPNPFSPLPSVKYFTSIQWKDKFADLAAQFDVHKADLQFELQMYISSTVTSMKTTLEAEYSKASATFDLVFQNMRSTEERELAVYVASKGGAEKILALGNDALFDHVIRNTKRRSARMKQKQDGDDADFTPSSLRRDIEKTPEDVVRENAQAFDQKFSTICAQLGELKESVVRESDRIIKAVEGGPHERIVDRVRLTTTLTGHPRLTTMFCRISTTCGWRWCVV
jgi:hypothetical protein